MKPKTLRTDPIPRDTALTLIDRCHQVLGDRMFLFCGTALGAVRDGGLIPWDWDTDAAMLVEDWDDSDLDGFAKAGLVRHRYRRWESNDKTPWVKGIVGDVAGATVIQFRLREGGRWHLDLHVLARGVGLHSEMRFWKRKGVIVGNKKLNKKIVLCRTPAALVEGVRRVDFHGRQLNVPARAEELFEFCYQDWRTPLKERGDEQRRLTMHRYVHAKTLTTIYTAGVFDVLHHGHVRLLHRAKALGDRLVVGVVADLHTAKATVFSESERAAHVAGLGIADEVRVVGPTDRALLDELRPTAVVYGEDAAIDRAPLLTAAESMGVKVVPLTRTEGISSTEIKARVRAA